MKRTIPLRIAGAAILVVSVALVWGCESVFTYSPISALQRDAANLDPEEQIAIAEEAISSGDTEALTELLDDLRESENPEVLSVATDVAIALSGVPALITEVGATMFSVDTEDPEALEAALASVTEAIESTVNTEAVEDVVGLIEKTKDAGGTPTSEQYYIAAASITVKVVSELGSPESLLGDEELPDLTEGQEQELQTAAEYAEASGLSLEGMPLPIITP